MGRFCIKISILLFISGCSLFASIPVQVSSLKGAAALEARYKLISAAEKYLGTPYRYGGVDKKGLDCSGLVFLSFKESLNVSAPRNADSMYSWAEKIPSSDLRPGDLVFFVTGSTSKVSHVGIFTGNGQFIHSASDGPKTGVMYSSLDESYWKRTYKGAGRVLPWDSGAEAALAESSARANGNNASRSSNPAAQTQLNGGSGSSPVVWASSTGLFTGGGLAWTFGGFLPGAPDVFRGLAAQVKIGYKGFLFGDSFLIALEARPELDRGLGISRLPLTLSMGSDKFQVFAGPALTFGEPVLQTGEAYRPAFAWLGELGVSCAFPPINIGQGALSVFGELAWQPYFGENETGFGSDLAANTRISAGLRYLFLF